MDPIAFSLGPISIRWYGILISSAVALGTFLAVNEGKRRGIDPEHILNLIILVVPLGFLGARLYYVIFKWDYFGKNPSEIFAVWHGGLAIHGALIFGTAAAYFYIRRNRLDFWRLTDVLAPSIVLGQALGRWGNFFNQEAHGGPVGYEFISRFPEFIQRGMFIEGQFYHPTFLYESLWNMGVFVVLLLFRRRGIAKKGDIFLGYIVLYSLGRLVIESLRMDSLMFGPFRAAQIVSVLAMGLASLLIVSHHRGLGSKN